MTAVHVRVDVNGTAVLSISGDLDRTGADHIHAATIVAWQAAAVTAGTIVGFRNATDHLVRQAAAYGYRDLFG